MSQPSIASKMNEIIICNINLSRFIKNEGVQHEVLSVIREREQHLLEPEYSTV